MNYIVGDIGNTSTRICLLNKKFSIVKSVIIDTKKIFKKKHFKNIFKKFLKENINSKFLFSSVVPSAFKVNKLDGDAVPMPTLTELSILKRIKMSTENT